MYVYADDRHNKVTCGCYDTHYVIPGQKIAPKTRLPSKIGFTSEKVST